MVFYLLLLLLFNYKMLKTIVIMFYLPNGNSISRLFCAFKHFNEDS